MFSEQVSADLAYGALTTVRDIGWALTAVGLPKGASAPVALSILKPTIALFFPSTANRNRPEGSMVGPPKTELEAKGEPAIGVSAPEFASTLKPSIPPADAEAYKNFPDGSKAPP